MTTKIQVLAKPNKKHNHLYWQEVEGEKILIAEINAPPVDGKANKLLQKFIAEFMGVTSNAKTI